MKIILSLLLLMNLFTSCQKNDQGTVIDFAQPVQQLNVSYGSDSLQRMDIYLPAGRSAAATKSIVLVHGGGWNAGSKLDFATYIDTFKRRLPDYALFNVDYRLATTGRIFPTQEMDVKAALEFIAHNATQYGINTNNVVLMGVSAGGHLSLLQAYKYNSPIKVKAVVDMFGPTDLTEMYQKPWHHMIPFLLQALTGTTPQEKPEVYQQSSPAFFVSRQSPATLILQGGADPVVNKSQSLLLAEKLQKAGVQHELVLYPNEGHGWYGANLVDSFNRIVAFLNAQVQ